MQAPVSRMKVAPSWQPSSCMVCTVFSKHSSLCSRAGGEGIKLQGCEGLALLQVHLSCPYRYQCQQADQAGMPCWHLQVCGSLSPHCKLCDLYLL